MTRYLYFCEPSKGNDFSSKQRPILPFDFQIPCLLIFFMLVEIPKPFSIPHVYTSRYVQWDVFPTSCSKGELNPDRRTYKL